MESSQRSFDVVLTRRDYRRYLTLWQRRRKSAVLVICWLVFAYFLVSSAGDFTPVYLAAALQRLWPIPVVLAVWTVWMLWLSPAVYSASRRARRFYGSANYDFGDESIVVTSEDGTRVERPYSEFKRVECLDGFLTLVWKKGRAWLVPLPEPDDADRLAAWVRAAAGWAPEPVGKAADGAGKYSPSPLTGLRANLRAGLRIMTFRKTGLDRFDVSPDQVLLLALLVLGIDGLVEYLSVGGPASLNMGGLSYEATGLLLLITGAYLVVRVNRVPARVLGLLVLLLSMDPFFRLLSGFVEWTWSMLQNPLLIWLSYLTLFAWMITAWYRALRITLAGSPERAALSLLLLAGVAVMPLWALQEQRLWYAQQSDEPEQPPVNVEDTYYRQPALLNAVMETIQPEREGVIDLYHIGFGSDASQNVFRQEVMHVKRILDDGFDTDGRSMVLINNRETLNEVPLASLSNLRLALKAMSGRMNVDEDVLLLYLTSHGSEGRELAVDFWPLRLNTLAAGELRRALDDSGIRWRVIVISACYSGGFIDSLKNDNTLIITAAAADRQSFGCDSKNEYTYFGEAFFKDALARARSFTQAFQLASEIVSAREQAENLEPSGPMMSAGEGIVGHLRQLEERYLAMDCAPETLGPEGESGASPCPGTVEKSLDDQDAAG